MKKKDMKNEEDMKYEEGTNRIKERTTYTSNQQTMMTSAYSDRQQVNTKEYREQTIDKYNRQENRRTITGTLDCDQSDRIVQKRHKSTTHTKVHSIQYIHVDKCCSTLQHPSPHKTQINPST